EKHRAAVIEHDHAHVIAVRPDGELGVVEEIVAEMKAVAMVRAGGVARDRDRDALVGRSISRRRELTDDPAVGELIIEQYGIAAARSLADAAEAAPDRGDPDRAENRGARRLVEDLVALVDDLDVLREAGFTVRVRRRAVAGDARERNPVEVQDRGGHVRRGD